jgi:DNA polymerase-1
MKEPLYLIDAYALIYRSYFAFISRPLKNSAGENISAFYGFARLVVSLLESAGLAGGGEKFRLAAVFDSRSPTFRKQKFPEYKATRQKAPEDLHAQIPKVETFLDALGVKSLRVEGFEADDIIATLAEKCRKEGRECHIVSSDKDLLQLVGDGIFELRPAKGAGSGDATSLLPNYERMGAAEVKAEWGVPPEKILDLLSLTGDSSDNVPGVKGIGGKTALKLIQRFGSLDEIYQNIAAIEGTIGKKLAENKENAYISRDLITLVYDVPLEIRDIDDFSLENLNRAAGAEVLIREEAPSLARQLQGREQGAENREQRAENREQRIESREQRAESREQRIEDGGGSPPRSEAYGFSATPPAGAGPRNAPLRGSATPDISAEETACGGPRLPSSLLTANSSLLGEGDYKMILSLDELAGFFDKAKEQGYFSLDFETDSLDAWHANPVGLSLALQPREAFYVPLERKTTRPELEAENGRCLPHEPVRALLAPLLDDPAITVVAHNAKYDYEVSRGWGIPRWQAKIWDTMVAAWVCDSDRGGYSLDSLASSWLNWTALAYDAVVPKGCTFADVPIETACRYSAEDADLCLRLKILLTPRLAEIGAEELFTGLEMPLLPVLAEMEGAGIKIEAAHLKLYGTELAAELDGIQAETWNLAGHKFNLASPKQLQEVLFVERHLKPTKKTKTGWSTDVAVLEELAREDRLPELILRHRTLAKLKSTYVDTLAGMADGAGRLHTNFIQTGTATGRLSSRDPNLQNIPIRDDAGRRIREAFVAADGSVLISADYSQIELVVLAHLSGDKNLAAAFKDGTDVHVRTAALIFGIDEKNVDPAQRRMAKIINFGVMYGMSAYRLSNELKIGRREAADFISAYFQTYSGVRDFISDLIKQTEKTGYVTTLAGRRRYISAINSANKTEKAAAERVTVNTPIQGSAADIVKRAMLDLDRELWKGEGRRKKGDGVRMLLQVHDELILECPEREAEKTINLIRWVMEGAVQLSVPLRVSVESGRRWGDFH